MFNDLRGMIDRDDWGSLMTIYGFGAAATFGVLALMYRYALKKKNELDLNEIEVFDTHTKIGTNVWMGSVPLLSALISLIFYDSAWAGALAGPIYFLYTPIMFIYGHRVDKRRKKLLASLNVNKVEEQSVLQE